MISNPGGLHAGPDTATTVDSKAWTGASLDTFFVWARSLQIVYYLEIPTKAFIHPLAVV